MVQKPICNPVLVVAFDDCSCSILKLIHSIVHSISLISETEHIDVILSISKDDNAIARKELTELTDCV